MRLGQWGAKFDRGEYENFIDACLDLGLTDFDHADIYGSYTTEAEFGEVFKQRPDLKQKVHITTKCGIKYPSPNRPDISIKHYDFSKAHIIKSVNNSLENLQVENIKLLLLHRPDYLMEADEVASAFEELKNSGKVSFFGVSNFSLQQYEKLSSAVELLNNQIEFSLIQPSALEDDGLDYFQKKKVKLTAWSPLGGGDAFQNGQHSELYSCVEEMATRYECTAYQILYAWINRNPADLTIVTGTSRIERIKEALEAEKVDLSRADWYLLLEKRLGHPVA